MATANTEKKDSIQFKNKIQEPNTNNSIENIEIENFKLPLDKIIDINFVNNKWKNIDAKNNKFENVNFKDCHLSHINFRNTTLINVNFINCTLNNVIMNNSMLRNVKFKNSHLISTDTNIDNSYLELDIDTLSFEKSKLENISFYKSKGEFIFNKSKLSDVSGQNLKGGSIYFNEVDAFDIDFSRSTLTTFEIKNSIIKQSKANNCKIKSILLDNSTLDFPIGAGIGYESVTSNNSGSVIIGASPVNQVNINGCPKGTRTIMVGGDTFNTIEIKDCSPDEIVFFKSKGKSVSIKNATVYKLDFRKSEIENLILDNIYIKSRLNYSDSKIKNIDTKNIVFDNDIKIKNSDSNIEIKEDKKQISTH